jgi:small-conductance mechanosensitive channel
LYLLLVVTDRLIGDMLSADSPRSRAFAANLGIDPRRLGLIGTLLSGATRAVFVLLAIALAIGPWEIAASDLSETARRAVFGIKLGDINISFGTVFSAVFAFAMIVALTRIVQRWLETRLLPATEIEPSLRLAIATVFGYVGFILALIAAMAEIGIDPQKIALVAGALSVGIGFGLQSIVSNFVSGLILLAERPIRVGDQIVVKGDEGFVRRISVRATEIETFDRASVIIPNSELITGVVKNWTHANTLGRLNIRVTTGYDADAEKVIEVLKACVADHPGVLKQPPPAVLLAEFGATAMTFDIFCVVPNLGERGQIKSDIQIAILRQFRAAGIALSPPQDVRLVAGAPQAAAAGKS